MSVFVELFQGNPILFAIIIGVVGILIFFATKKDDEKQESSRTVDKARIISRKELNKHNSFNDLWVSIHEGVYDISKFATSHPGGEVIANHAGGDASGGFFGIQHPKRAYAEIHDYQVGILAEKEKTRYFHTKEDEAEINKHNKEGDCWIIVEDRVYDVSQWMKEHPGGNNVFVENAGVAGKEKATKSFKGHSKSTQATIHQYFVGYYGAKYPTKAIDELSEGEKNASPSYNAAAAKGKTASAAPTKGKKISLKEVAKHNTEADGWVAVHKKVYSIPAAFYDEHPGGSEVLINALGKDATSEFDVAGHPEKVTSTLEPMYLGDLE